MSHISDAYESGILEHLLRSSSLAKPSNLSLALLGAVGPDNASAQTMGEIAYTNNYNRFSFGPPHDSLFSTVLQDALGSGYMTNATGITFNTATGDWGWISGVALMNASGQNQGTPIFIAPIVPQFIQNNTTLTIAIGSLRVLLH